MTLEEFRSLEGGEFVDDLFNGVFRVYYVGDDSEYFDEEDYSDLLKYDPQKAEEYKRHFGKYFSCEHVDYDAETGEWYVCGSSFDVYEWYAVNEDNGNGLKRWDVYTAEEIEAFKANRREEWELFNKEFKNAD